MPRMVNSQNLANRFRRGPLQQSATQQRPGRQAACPRCLASGGTGWEVEAVMQCQPQQSMPAAHDRDAATTLTILDRLDKSPLAVACLGKPRSSTCLWPWAWRRPNVIIEFQPRQSVRACEQTSLSRGLMDCAGEEPLRVVGARRHLSGPEPR